MVLPELERPVSIFEVHPASAWEKGDLINIEFFIPLAYKDRFAHTARYSRLQITVTYPSLNKYLISTNSVVSSSFIYPLHLNTWI